MRSLVTVLGIFAFFGILLSMAGIGSAGVFQFTDDTFDNADWDSTVLTAANGGSGAFDQITVGGNPGDYREIAIDVLASGEVAVVSKYLVASFDPSADGPVSAIDYSEDAILTTGNPFGQATWPLIEQGGNRYVVTGLFANDAGWTSKSLSSLSAEDFSLIDANLVFDHDSHPDFSTSGGVMEFGFVRDFAEEIVDSAVAGIDNWSVTVTAGDAIGLCGIGAVAAGCGPAEDVLFINGDNGGADRILTIGTGTPIVGTIQEPVFAIGDGRDTESCIYVWVGEPNALDIVPLPQQLGNMCFGPFVIATLNPNKIWNSIGITNKLGVDNAPGPPPTIIDATAFTFLNLVGGLGQTIEVTFQAIIEDGCSQGNVTFSVTNGVVLRIQ